MSPPDRGPPIPRSIILLTLAAIALRLLLFLGRGNYVAFDEGWYLLLGRNVWSGNGYTLTGLQHVALSPLFPVLAGGVDWIFGNAIWAGRVVAAVSSGLLVVPCWFIFRRLAGPAVAGVGALLVAVMPSLAPFVVPYWIGWDLWQGAEPLFHLFLFSGIALFLRAWDDRRLGSAVGCGAAFALAYLARPEAIVAFGLLGVAAVGATMMGLRSSAVSAPPLPALARRAGACALAFVVLSAPYWLYLQDSLGRWTITGRAVQLVPESVTPRVARGQPAPNRIETMLWEGDSSPYIQTLYALDPSATRLANGYWGVQPEGGAATGGPGGGAESAEGAVSEGVSDPVAPPKGASGATPSAANSRAPGAAPPPASSAADGETSSPWLLRYAEALGVAVPWYLWLFVIPGLAAPAAPGRDRRLDLEALVGIPLVVTSVLIARTVAVDPRTQLFLAPLVAFYAARGVLAVGRAMESRLGERVREERVTRLLAGTLGLGLLATSLFRLGMSLSVGSPHHVVADQNAAVGEAIRRASPESATVMSFHPAVALFSHRDWRALPLEPMPRIVRYARTQPDPYLVLSVFYPPEVRPLEEPHYLIVPVPDGLPESDEWRIDVPERRTVYAFGGLVPRE